MAGDHELDERTGCLGDGMNLYKTARLYYKFLKWDYKYKKEFKRRRKNGITRVGFFLISDAVFSLLPLYELMMQESNIEPFIVVVPDTLHFKERAVEEILKIVHRMSEKYDTVLSSWDESTQKFIDFSEECDLVCFDYQYDCLTHEYYKSAYFKEKIIPTIYSFYGYAITEWDLNVCLMEYDLTNHWRVFLPTKNAVQGIRKNERLGLNAVLVGHPKMDTYYQRQIKTEAHDTVKTIIIAPHHTIQKDKDGFNLSNFLQYHEFFLELPRLYPDIHFIFRPHILLKSQLLNNKLWTEGQISNYFEKMAKYNNVEYQESGDFFDAFIKSDAMIHDCVSFMAEYLFTGKPVCYMRKVEVDNNNKLNEFGEGCMKVHYQAISKEDIIRFIDEVVLEEKDGLKEERKQFFDMNVKFNYPHASESIFMYLKKKFRI